MVQPIETALQDPAVRERFSKADVILGHDRSQGPEHVTVFAGRQVLEHMVGRSESLRIMRFSYDQRTDSLEFFCAACDVLRGGTDYRASDELKEQARA